MKRASGKTYAVVAALALFVSPAALASDAFTDVPDGAPFHDEISIFKQTNVTTGCTATTFCPTDYVRRQAMAAFIDRALGLVVRPGETTKKGVVGSRVQMLDDDYSFVGTACSFLCGTTWLSLQHLGVPVLRLYGDPQSPNLIGGHQTNGVTAGANGAVIGGGGYAGSPNRVTDIYGAIAGGRDNTAGDGAGSTVDHPYGVVAGGVQNKASGAYATVAGGRYNTASGQASFAAGDNAQALQDNATVAGGYTNTASGVEATVVGGGANTASGYAATVAGGELNSATGNLSLAAGYRAKATQQGAFVWADSGAANVASPAADTFSVRASGGIWLGTTSSPSIPAGRFLNTSTGAYLSNGGVWTDLSDRNTKENVTGVDASAILARVAHLPLSRWNYKAQSASIRHLGPMAQDFAHAFGVGEDDRHIAPLDANGVALAAIQALDAQMRVKDARIASLARENRAQDARLAELERAVSRLSGKERA